MHSTGKTDQAIKTVKGAMKHEGFPLYLFIDTWVYELCDRLHRAAHCEDPEEVKRLGEIARRAAKNGFAISPAAVVVAGAIERAAWVAQRELDSSSLTDGALKALSEYIDKHIPNLVDGLKKELTHSHH